MALLSGDKFNVREKKKEEEILSINSKNKNKDHFLRCRKIKKGTNQEETHRFSCSC